MSDLCHMFDIVDIWGSWKIQGVLALLGQLVLNSGRKRRRLVTVRERPLGNECCAAMSYLNLPASFG